MKKSTLTVAAVLLAGGLLTSSCIGSFALFNKYEKWQCNMTSTKIVNGIVGLILQPIVAPICITVDAIVLNTIEFWSGSNYPLQLDATKVAQQIVKKIEQRRAIITVDWRYRLLVFFWRLIPRWLWVRMRIA